MQAGRLEIEIVAEIARLQSDMAKVQKAVDSAAQGIGRAGKAANDNFTRMGTSGKLAGHQIQNLTYQLNDMIVGLASGQKPMTVFMQQGAQIGQIMGQAGVGIGGLAKQIGGLAVGLVAAHPVMAALAAATGVAFVAFKDFQSTVNEDASAKLQAYAQSLGLTKDEIEKAGGAAVTSGDMLMGLWDVFKEFTGVEAIFADVKGWIVDNIRAAVLDAKKNISQIYAAVAATVDGIKAVWKNIGPILGEAVIAGANVAIGAVEKLINSAIDALNTLMMAVNPVMALAKMAGFDMGAKHVSLGRIENQFAGAGAKAADAFLGSYQRHLKKAEGAFDTFMGDWAAAGVNRAKGRLSAAAEDAADKAGKNAGKKAGKSAAEEFPKELQKALDEAEHWLGNLEKDADAWAKALASKSTLQDIGDLFDELRKKQTGYIDALVKAADIAANRAQALMGAIGGTIGRLGSALTSTDPKAALLGMGGIGTLAGLVLNPNTINDLAKNIATGVRDVFGEGTPFADTMGGLLAGAGIGGIVGGSLFGGSKGGQIGSMLGGAAGQAIGSSISALGSFGGPIGSIVGAIAGGLLGGLLKKAKTGKATFGADLSVSTSGNSNSRIAAASGLAGNVVDSLNQIADAFGATLGTFTGTVGVRNKSLRYDPTGMGNTKTSKGAIDFGQDQEALIKAVIKDAISDGVFEGLSEGVKRILNQPGDIEKNLRQALTYQSIGDSLLAAKDPTGAAIADLDRQKKAWLESVKAAGNAAEDIAKVEELYGLKRVEIAKQAFEATRPAREQEIRILELLGKDTEALAASRALELEGMDPLLRTKQEYIYRLEDEAEAAAKAAQAQANLQALNIRYFQALGDDAKVKELVRANELAGATDDLTRSILQLIYAAEDQTEATNAATKAAQDAADAAKRIADERYGLETQLLQLQGNTAELRARELAALDPANRALQQMIYGLQDAADAAAKAAQAAQEAAAKEKAITDERMGLMRSLWQLTGDTASLRADQLSQLDPSNRALQEYIWSLEDAKAAADAAKEAEQERVAKLNDLRSQLTEAYNRESGALQGTIDKFNGFARSIAAFRDNLLGQSNPAMGFAMAQGQFRRTSAMAQFGNAGSLESFQGDAQAYIDAAQGGTYAQYRRAIGDVLAGSSGAIFGASGVANAAQRQLDAMQQQYDALVEIKDAQISFAEALKSYEDASRAELPIVTATISTSIDNLSAKVEAGTATAQEAKTTAEAAMTAMVVALNSMERRLRNWDDGDGVRISSSATDPVHTVTP